MNPRIGFVSTYPPTQCGLATFTASLEGALTGTGPEESVVVRLLDSPNIGSSAVSGAELLRDDPQAVLASSARLNDCDAVIIQHEFGVFGGPDGDDVLRLLDQLRVPTVVVLHTVLIDPTPHQREVLEAVIGAADAVVTMGQAAHERLQAAYRVDMAKVRIIAHGAPAARPTRPSNRVHFSKGTPTILTWGLIGPGKGIEWGIEAMAHLGDIRPAARYLIAGQTHPKVVAHQGETYRDRLSDQVRRLGLSTSVRFDPRYRDARALADVVASADVVLLPYDSTDQVTSGVLIEAIAAGKPVVATAFPHAVELLSDGTGIVVAHRDPLAIADALRTVLTRPETAAAMSAKASSATAHLLWPAIAAEYRSLIARLARKRVAA
jgi:polysaccharide biosynthesis protein PslF